MASGEGAARHRRHGVPEPGAAGMAHDPEERDAAAGDRAHEAVAAEQEDRARYLLALVGLEGFEDKRPSELSGGMRQRASLCRALVHKPEVLILDEPFGALDAFTREDLWQTMHEVKEKEPFTGVLITHDLRESIFLADQVVVLSGRPARTQYVLDVPKGARAISSISTRPRPPRCWRSCATRSRSRRAAHPPKNRPPPMSPPWPMFPIRCPRRQSRIAARGRSLTAAVWRRSGGDRFLPSGSSGLGQRLAELRDGLALRPAGGLRPKYWELFLVMGWQTLWRTVVGLVLAVVVGVLIGMVMGFSRTMRDALYPLLVGFNAIPKATVVPIVALLFVGAHDFNTVLIAFMISFFPIAVSVSIGLSTLEPEYRDILRSLGASPDHDLLEDRAAQDAAGVLRRAEGGGHAGLHRHQPDGDRQPAWPRAGRAVRFRQDELGLPADVRGADRARLPGASCSTTSWWRWRRSSPAGPSAMMIAEEDINAAGGVLGCDIEVVIGDSEGLPERAVAMMERLITQDGVVAVGGGYHSSVGVASKDVAERSRHPGGLCRDLERHDHRRQAEVHLPHRAAVVLGLEHRSGNSR
jgi:hypothetical protein